MLKTTLPTTKEAQDYGKVTYSSRRMKIASGKQ